MIWQQYEVLKVNYDSSIYIYQTDMTSLEIMYQRN